MNKKTAQLLKSKSKAFARSKGIADWKYGYRQLKKLWNNTTPEKRKTVFE